MTECSFTRIFLKEIKCELSSICSNYPGLKCLACIHNAGNVKSNKSRLDFYSSIYKCPTGRCD